MTNYSLLAYQTCDDSLKDGLKLLIDSLFNENDKNLGDKFKSIVNPLNSFKSESSKSLFLSGL